MFNIARTMRTELLIKPMVAKARGAWNRESCDQFHLGMDESACTVLVYTDMDLDRGEEIQRTCNVIDHIQLQERDPDKPSYVQHTLPGPQTKTIQSTAPKDRWL